MVAVHSNTKSSATVSSSSSSRLQLLHLLLETVCAFLNPPNSASDAVSDAADSEAWSVSTMGREALVTAGMGEAVVLVSDGLLTSTQMMMTIQSPLQLLALCCRVVALLAGPPSSSSTRSSRFLCPPIASSKQQQRQQQHCCDQGNDDDPADIEELIATVNLAPTLSSLGLLVTPTPIASLQPRWEGVPSGDGMGLEPFSTRLFQTDLRKTLSQAANNNGSAVAAAYRLRASGCCETIVQVINQCPPFLLLNIIPLVLTLCTTLLCSCSGDVQGRAAAATREYC